MDPEVSKNYTHNIHRPSTPDWKEVNREKN